VRKLALPEPDYSSSDSEQQNPNRQIFNNITGNTPSPPTQYGSARTESNQNYQKFLINEQNTRLLQGYTI
jgi:hypothetical protein